MKTCKDCKHHRKPVDPQYKMLCGNNQQHYIDEVIGNCASFEEPKSQTVELKETDLRKAYNEGCNDVKKVLENLYPDFDFEDRITVDNCNEKYNKIKLRGDIKHQARCWQIICYLCEQQGIPYSNLTTLKEVVKFIIDNTENKKA